MKKKGMTPAELGAFAVEFATKYKGQSDDMERAIGMLFVAQVYGWKVLYLVDSPRYVRKLEEKLGIKFQDTFEPRTDYSERSVGYKIAKNVSNFWKAVRGEMGKARSADFA